MNMALCRMLNPSFPMLFYFKNAFNATNLRLISTTQPLAVLPPLAQGNSGWGRLLRVMKLRRKLAGPDRVRKRNEWDNWNYKAEIYAFSKRLHENITEDTLRCAFIHESYMKSEEQKRKELDMPLQDVSLDLKSNTSLVDEGMKIATDFIKRYLRHCFPLLPEEGIVAVHDHLLSEKVLSHVSFNIGTKDLICSAEYPPDNSTLSSTLLAIIGSIAKDNSIMCAEKFILDFICMQLVGKDVFDIWDLQKAGHVLNSILVKHGMSEYEPRLIYESGRNTIEAIYNVGLYSDKVFLGRAYGETLNIAEELAAFDCLRKIFEIKESEKPISPLKLAVNELQNITIANPTMECWYSETLKLRKCL